MTIMRNKAAILYIKNLNVLSLYSFFSLFVNGCPTFINKKENKLKKIYILEFKNFCAG